MCTTKSIRFERSGKHNYKVWGSENIWIDKRLKNNKNLIIGKVYRHPTHNHSSFVEKFSEILHTLNIQNCALFVLWNINLNLNKSKISHYAFDYTNILKSTFFSQLLDKPTRVTNLSQSIIDHIITNDHALHIAPGVIEYGDLSDYYPVFISTEKINHYTATPTEQAVF